MQPYATHNVKTEEPVYSQGCVSAKVAGQGNTVDKPSAALHAKTVEGALLQVFAFVLLAG